MPNLEVYDNIQFHFKTKDKKYIIHSISGALFYENQNIKNPNINNYFKPVIKNFFLPNQTRGCEWPIGHPEEQSFHFCSKKRFDNKPYCLEHCAIAYVSPEKDEEQIHINQVA